MADTTTFDGNFGLTSGAVEPEVGLAFGERALVIGDEAHPIERVADGDRDGVVQYVAFPAAVRLVRPSVLLRCLKPAGPGSNWTLIATKNGQPRVAVPLWRKAWNRPLADLAVPITPDGETFELGFSLAFSELGGGAALEPVPAVVVDELFEDRSAAPRPTLINRNPEPGEMGVPVGTPIVLEIIDPIGDAVDQTTLIELRVNGELAWSLAGGFSSRYSGPASLVEQVDGGRTWRVTVDPLMEFKPQTWVDVSVEYASAYGTSLSAAYKFETEDTVAPRVVRGDALSHDLVRVAFNEPVLHGDGSGAGDVLDPANWAVALASTSLDDGLPALGVSVASVTAVADSDGRAVDLHLDREMTAGARYTCTALGVEDIHGNAVDPDHDSVTVVGYPCPQPEGRRFDLLGWLPEMSVAEDHTRRGGSRETEALVKVWQHLFDRVLCRIDRFADIIDPDLAPEPFIDAMLADSGVTALGSRRAPFAFFGLDLLQKRRLLRAVIALYKQKGTDDGIIAAVLIFLGLDVSISVPAQEGVWVLDESELDVDTALGTEVARLLYSFWVVAPKDLTDLERFWIDEIASYARPSFTHYMGIVEPDEQAPPDHWELDASRLDLETELHGP